MIPVVSDIIAGSVKTLADWTATVNAETAAKVKALTDEQLREYSAGLIQVSVGMGKAHSALARCQMLVDNEQARRAARK
jgi:hypothetical protein